MSTDQRTKLASIKRFDQLIKYLREQMGWPIESDDFEEITFDYTPEELGIDMAIAAKIQEIKRLRPLSVNQPWGIFFVKFEPKSLPVVALRRLLSKVVLKKRASANQAERMAWSADDLLFISSYGEDENRQISFAHFSQDENKRGLPSLKVLGWDNRDTALHLDHVADTLITKLIWPINEDNLQEWCEKWCSAFTIKHRETITTSKNLSIELATLARHIRDRIRAVLSVETEKGPVKSLMAAFRASLVHDLDADGFADMYAQTISYGLLSARVANPSDQGADDLSKAMPVTNPFLKELMETFLDLGGKNNGKEQEVKLNFDELGVGEVVELLDSANMGAILRDFGDRNPQEDPVIHFYELFLKEYDAKKRMQRGVFYTPRPVVTFIVRSVDEALRSEFGLKDGLADTTTWGEMTKRFKDIEIPEGVKSYQPFVQILDPATGTGTFLVEVIDIIYWTMKEKWEREAGGPLHADVEGKWNSYVPKHLLPRLHGYELMMAPYAIAHMKIGLKLFETGYKFENNERTRIYLTNALEPVEDFSTTFAFAIPALAHESIAVNKIKRNQRFTVVIGNPPYSGISANNHPWIDSLLRGIPPVESPSKGYYEVDGMPLRERKNWLQDDYVKFFRFAEWSIQRSGKGVLGFISNNGYLDNLTFRGMRQKLLSTFQTISINDLHGNSKKKERAPDGSQDENVFEIMQGVAIILACKSCNSKKSTVLSTDLFGKREDKYAFLISHTLSTTDRNELKPTSPEYLMVPIDDTYRDEYETGLSLADVMPVHDSGIITSRDNFVIGFRNEEVLARVSVFLDEKLSKNEVADKLGIKENYAWRIQNARKELAEVTNVKDLMRGIYYRPFDKRRVLYHPSVVWRMRNDVMSHMQCGPQIGLVTTRKVEVGSFCHILSIRGLAESHCVSMKEVNYVFPLYTSEKNDSLYGTNRDKAIPNFEDSFINKIGFLTGENNRSNNARVAFNYLYAQLFSSSYRERYAQFLARDFPRLFLPESKTLLLKLVKLGKELVGYHLMDSLKIVSHNTTVVGSGDFQVEKASYSDETVWIDKAKTKGFRGIPEKVWSFHIGGYQVCEKWLKDRGPKKGQPGRILTDEDIDHYQKIVVSLNETIRIMAEIDEVIEEHGGWPDAFQKPEIEFQELEDREADDLDKAAEKGGEYS